MIRSNLLFVVNPSNHLAKQYYDIPIKGAVAVEMAVAVAVELADG